ncbi:MAG TPA: hypothetical protein VLH56_08515 [Dissulfurispiraceae bacterium]|nr:hypothetical protein [Dissulfurispiraceae bacterium]
MDRNTLSVIRNYDRRVVNSATVLAPLDQVVDCSTTTANGAYTLTLPPIDLAAGKIYSLFMSARAGTLNVTIQHHGDSLNWTNITFNLAADHVLLYSDGVRWFTLSSAGLP